jgi:GxxExxY protein
MDADSIMPGAAGRAPGLPHGAITGRVIGAFFEAYNELGFGFLESVYQEAMARAVTSAGLRIAREVPLDVWFRGEVIGTFRADLVVEDVVIVEVKAVRRLLETHVAQLLNYLRSTGLETGLLLNFGPRASFRRLAFANTRKRIRVHPRLSAAKLSEPDRRTSPWPAVFTS